MRYFNCLWLMVLFLITMGCGTDRIYNAKNAEQVRLLNPSGSFISDIDKKIPGVREYLRKQERFLGLDSLANGFDSVQIRIWMECLMTPSHLVILTCRKAEWSAEILDLKYHGSPDGAYGPDSLSAERRPATPKSGWNSFITHLFNLNILSLSSVPDYTDAMDGCGIGIEIATRKIYRCYSSINPALGHLPAQRDIISMMKLIDSELNLKSIWGIEETDEPQAKPEKLEPKELILEELPEKKDSTAK